MRRESIVSVVAALIPFLGLPSAHAAKLKGVIVWFYSLEVKDGKERGNVLTFKQTAGVTR